MLAVERELIPPHEVIDGINPELSQIISRMLATNPEERYRSAQAIITALSHCLYGSGIGPTTASLANYLMLLRDPNSSPTKSTRETLTFLEGEDGKLDFQPRWELADAAKQAISKGANPSRKCDEK